MKFKTNVDWIANAGSHRSHAHTSRDDLWFIPATRYTHVHQFMSMALARVSKCVAYWWADRVAAASSIWNASSVAPSWITMGSWCEIVIIASTAWLVLHHSWLMCLRGSYVILMFASAMRWLLSRFRLSKSISQTFMPGRPSVVNPTSPTAPSG